MINAVDHFSQRSLKFLLGRMSAESTPPRVEKLVDAQGNNFNLVVFDIASGFAHRTEEDKVIENTIMSAAKITIKLFSEQSATFLPDELEAAVIRAVQENSLDHLTEAYRQQLQDKGVILSVVSDQDKGRGISIQAKSILVRSFPEQGISETNTVQGINYSLLFKEKYFHKVLFSLMHGAVMTV